MFGPPIGKKCVMFVDDLSLPQADPHGAFPPLELLRQMLDHATWYDVKKEVNTLHLEDIQVTLVYRSLDIFVLFSFLTNESGSKKRWLLNCAQCWVKQKCAAVGVGHDYPWEYQTWCSSTPPAALQRHLHQRVQWSQHQDHLHQGCALSWDLTNAINLAGEAYRFISKCVGMEVVFFVAVPPFVVILHCKCYEKQMKISQI